MWRVLLVGAGGFVGTLARYGLSVWIQRLAGGDFPFGTVLVNIIGSFVIGVVAVLALERGVLHPEARLVLGVGLCGGFTTMSAFSFETVVLWERGLAGLAFANVAVTLMTCIGAAWVGMVMARMQ